MNIVLIIFLSILVSLLYQIIRNTSLIADDFKYIRSVLDHVTEKDIGGLSELSKIQRSVERIEDITTMTESQKIKRDFKIDHPDDYKDIIGE